jgi:hypothetical protein
VSELLGQRRGDHRPEALLDDVLGVLVGHREQRGLTHDAVERAEPHERALLRGDRVVDGLEGAQPDLRQRGRIGFVRPRDPLHAQMVADDLADQLAAQLERSGGLVRHDAP